MDLATATAPAEESAVDDFAVLLLRALGYVRIGSFKDEEKFASRDLRRE